MNVGDLVKVSNCTLGPEGKGGLDLYCGCFFCSGKSNRVGFVLSRAPFNSWDVMFDCGMWRVCDFDEARGEVKVLSESR